MLTGIDVDSDRVKFDPNGVRRTHNIDLKLWSMPVEYHHSPLFVGANAVFFWLTSPQH